MRRVLNLTLLFCLLACTNSNDYTQTNVKLHNQFIVSDRIENPMDEDICIISENPCFLGEITSFCFLNEARFIISTIKPSQIIVFDRNGEQIMCLNQPGKGPMEFLSPSIVKSYNENIYVWCDQQLKLIVFDKFANPIREYVGFKDAIKDFAIWDKRAYLYITGGLNVNLMKEFNLEKGEFINEFGNVSEESILLSLFDGAGGLFVTDSILFYSSPDQLGVFVLNKSNNLYEFVEFIDNDFKVSKISNAVEIINGDRNKAIEYVSSNSVIKGLYDLNSRIVLVAEVGKFDLKKKNISSSRFNKYYIFNKNEKTVIAFKEQIDFSIMNRSFTGFNGSLYYIQFNPAKENEMYMLKRRIFEFN